MPRPPRFRHPVRSLRTILQLSQPAFGELIGVVGGTIQAVENGRLPISPKIARRIYWATGADYQELLKGRAGRLRNHKQQRYTPQDYARWKKRYEQPANDLVELIASTVLPRIRSALTAAGKRGKLTNAYCEFSEAVESAADRIEQKLR